MTELPFGMQVFSFVVSACLAILQISNLINRPKLRVRLTKEMFFRITDSGESLFANLVYLSQNGANEIQSIDFFIDKTSSPQKHYRLDVEFTGTKKIAPGPIADHHFFTKSTVFLVPRDSFGSLTFMLKQPDFSKEIKTCIDEFRNELTQLKQKYEIVSRAATTGEQYRAFSTNYSTIMGTSSLKIMRHIQIEPGKYMLRVVARYKPLGTIPFRKMKTAESRIEFEISEKFKKTFDDGLKRYFDILATNIVFSENANVPLPEYNPDSVTEKSN